MMQAEHFARMCASRRESLPRCHRSRRLQWPRNEYLQEWMNDLLLRQLRISNRPPQIGQFPFLLQATFAFCRRLRLFPKAAESKHAETPCMRATGVRLAGKPKSKAIRSARRRVLRGILRSGPRVATKFARCEIVFALRFRIQIPAFDFSRSRNGTLGRSCLVRLRHIERYGGE